jgi:hypothetical protein
MQEKRIRLPDFLTPEKFGKRFSDEESCRDHLFSTKYPDGFICKKCKSTKFYQLNGKRNRVLQCVVCRKQESLTSNTIFQGTRTPLLKWFWAFYYVTQHKKGISSVQLGKNIGVSDMTAWLILMKIRKSMQENPVKYQIGGENKTVQADEIEIGGKCSDKQKVLCLLELDEEHKIRRFRFSPLKDKTSRIIQLNLEPMVAKGSIIKTDGNKAYNFLEKSMNFTWDKLSHWEENHEHKHVKELNIVIGNFKNWYRGIFSHYDKKNAAYYLNEFAYRFNRRRTESNIFDRLVNRSITRPQMVRYRDLITPTEYYPMAA